MYCTIIAAVSLDGFIADANGVSIKTSPEDTEILKQLLASHEVHVMGRKTFEAHVSKKASSKKRIVLTSSPETLIKKYGPIATFTSEPIEHILATQQTPALVLGGSEVYTQALQTNYVDKVVLVIEPMLVKRGTPFLHYGSLEALGYKLYKNDVVNTSGTIIARYTKN